MQIHHKGQQEIQGEGQHGVARRYKKVDRQADQSDADLRVAKQLDLAIKLGDPGRGDHGQDGRHHARGQEGGHRFRAATQIVFRIINGDGAAHHVADRARDAHAAQHQPLVVLQQHLQLFQQRLFFHHVHDALGGGEIAEQEQGHAHHRHHGHGRLVADGRVAAAPALRQDRHDDGHHEGADLGKEQAVAIGRQALVRIAGQAADQRDVGDAHAGRHDGHQDIRRIRPDQFGVIAPFRRGEHKKHADAERHGQPQQIRAVAARGKAVAVGDLPHDEVGDGAHHFDGHEQQGQVRGFQAIDIGIEKGDDQHHRRDDDIERHVARAEADLFNGG